MSRGRLRQIRRRIQSTESTMQITRAMEMVARAKVQKVEKLLKTVRRFAEEARNIVVNLPISGVDDVLLTGGKGTAIMVVTADMGLCGAFNTDIAKTAEKMAGEFEDFAGFIVIGSRGLTYLSKRNEILHPFPKLYDTPSFSVAERVLDTILDDVREGRYGKLKLVYSEFKSRLVQRPSTMDLIPIKIERKEEGDRIRKIWEYEPEVEGNVERYLFLYLSAELFRVLYETKVGELYARMNSMKNATDNAKEVIRQLTLAFNKARQASITQEIIEVVNGAEALKE